MMQAQVKEFAPDFRVPEGHVDLGMIDMTYVGSTK